jgi:hypothetical protein
MTRTSAFTAMVLLATASAAFAQTGASAPPPGTNSAGTAQSSGSSLNREPGTTTGSAALGTGRARTEPTTSPDTAINAENNTIDRKLKSICRGC